MSMRRTAVPALVAFLALSPVLVATNVAPAFADRFPGSGAGELIRGTPRDDVMFGRGGNDQYDGRGGDDVIRLGPGQDIGWGKSDDDRIWGDGGADDLKGGAGDDRLYAGSNTRAGGPDLLYGQSGNDVLHGENSRNVAVYGGPGADRILVERALDVLVKPGPGDDLIVSGDDADTRVEVHSRGGGVDTIRCGVAYEVIYPGSEDSWTGGCDEVHLPQR